MNAQAEEMMHMVYELLAIIGENAKKLKTKTPSEQQLPAIAIGNEDTF